MIKHRVSSRRPVVDPDMTMTPGGLVRRPSAGRDVLPPTGKPSPSTPSGHLAVPFGRPNTGRQSHRGAQPTASPGRRGSWLSNESKSAPDEAAVRRILAEPSAYAQRPATAGVAHRAVGGQRMAEGGLTRGGQFRISSLEKVETECIRCAEQLSIIKALKLKLLHYKNRDSVGATRLHSDLDAEVEALRQNRDDLKAKVDMLESMLKNQRQDDSATLLQEENSRLMALVAELRQTLVTSQSEKMAACKRLEDQLNDARAQAQMYKILADESHAKLSQSIPSCERHSLSLLELLVQCQQQGECQRRKLVDSLARNDGLRRERLEFERKHAEAEKRLQHQIRQTHALQEEMEVALSRQQQRDTHIHELVTGVKDAERNVLLHQQLLENVIMEHKACMAKACESTQGSSSEVAKLKEQLRIASKELTDTRASLSENQANIQRLHDKLQKAEEAKTQLQQEVRKHLTAKEEAQAEVHAQCAKLQLVEAALKVCEEQKNKEVERVSLLQDQLVQRDAAISTQRSEIERLTAELAAERNKEAPGTKVVVVTPKISVSMPDGNAQDFGKMHLPLHVLQDLVARQLGYTPDELFQVDDVSELGAKKKNSASDTAPKAPRR